MSSLFPEFSRLLFQSFWRTVVSSGGAAVAGRKLPNHFLEVVPPRGRRPPFSRRGWLGAWALRLLPYLIVCVLGLCWLRSKMKDIIGWSKDWCLHYRFSRAKVFGRLWYPWPMLHHCLKTNPGHFLEYSVAFLENCVHGYQDLDLP